MPQNTNLKICLENQMLKCCFGLTENPFECNLVQDLPIFFPWKKHFKHLRCKTYPVDQTGTSYLIQRYIAEYECLYTYNQLPGPG